MAAPTESKKGDRGAPPPAARFGTTQRDLAERQELFELYNSIVRSNERDESRRFQITWSRCRKNDYVPEKKDGRLSVRIARVIHLSDHIANVRGPSVVFSTATTRFKAVAKVFTRRQDMSWQWVAFRTTSKGPQSCNTPFVASTRLGTSVASDPSSSDMSLTRPAWGGGGGGGGGGGRGDDSDLGSSMSTMSRMSYDSGASSTGKTSGRALLVCPYRFRRQADAQRYADARLGRGNSVVFPCWAAFTHNALLADVFISEALVTMLVSEIKYTSAHVIRPLSASRCPDSSMGVLYLQYISGGTLREWVSREEVDAPGFLSPSVVCYILFTVSLVLGVLQVYLQLKHHDLHDNNLFTQIITKGLKVPLHSGDLTRTKRLEQWRRRSNGDSEAVFTTSLWDADVFEYIVGDRTFYIPNMGILIKVADLGLSSLSIVGRRVGRMDMPSFDRGDRFGPWNNELEGNQGYDLQVFISALLTWVQGDHRISGGPSLFDASELRDSHVKNIKPIQNILRAAYQRLGGVRMTNPKSGRPYYDCVSDTHPLHFVDGCFGSRGAIRDFSLPIPLQVINRWRERRGVLGACKKSRRHIVSIATIVFDPFNTFAFDDSR